MWPRYIFSCKWIRRFDLIEYYSESKIFISFFFKKPRARKRVGIARGETGAQFRRPGESNDLGDADELIIDDGDVIDSEEDEAVLEEAEATLEGEDDDEGQTIHNERVSKTLRGKAIQIMERQGIFLEPYEEKIALQIFPRVSSVIFHGLHTT